jgi:hypothetical protein
MDDEECNIGCDAEETIENNINKKPVTMSPKKCMVGYNRHFRSSTTKSAASSNDQQKQSEKANRHGMSTEDDDDHFLALECDENLFDDRMNMGMDEEEKRVALASQKFVGNGTPSPFSNEKIDDTMPDFGFMKPQDNEKSKKTSKRVKKEPAKGKIKLSRPKTTNDK